MVSYEGAVIPRDRKTYAIVTPSATGIVTPEHLEKVAAIARKYQVASIKITGGSGSP